MATNNVYSSNTDLRSTVRPVSAIDWIALALVIIGGLNWGLVGAANFDLVAAIFGVGSTAARVVYVLVGLSALYLIFFALKLRTVRA